jgi:hypothetical protein
VTWDLPLLAIQVGQTPMPAEQNGAGGSNPLDVRQRAHSIGDPVPIVFGRMRNGAGGVFVSPGATECRFSNDAANAVTASYHLVLSEGRIGSLQVRDVFQRQCRVGSFNQTYNRRAGTWQPENVITAQAGYTKPEASYYCGNIGTYPDISTLSFQVTYPNGIDFWNRQVHCFIRDGMEVKRWLDNLDAVSSDSFADLAYWLMIRSAQIPEALIDTDSIIAASRFLNANNITTNCCISSSINYADLISDWGRYHLLRSSNRNGKAGLKPLLQVNSNGTINTSSLNIDYTFDDDEEDLIIPGSVDIRYTSWTDRQPFVVQITWRQQLDAGVGIIRTTEIRFAGTAAAGPYENHDLSAFCTREDHAVRVGAYILSRRVRSTHVITFKAAPRFHETYLQQGSVIRVVLSRNAIGDVESYHDFLYQVEEISKSLDGIVTYTASHLPVNESLQSIIALDVTSATPSGILLTSNLTGTGCDINSSSNTTVPANVGITVTPAKPPLEIPRWVTLAGGASLISLLPSRRLKVTGDPIKGSALIAKKMPTIKCSSGQNATTTYNWYVNGSKINYDGPVYVISDNDTPDSIIQVKVFASCSGGAKPIPQAIEKTGQTINAGDLLPTGQTATTTTTYNPGDPLPWGVVESQPITIESGSVPIPPTKIFAYVTEYHRVAMGLRDAIVSYRKPAICIPDTNQYGAGRSIWFYDLAGELQYSGVGGPWISYLDDFRPIYICIINQDGTGGLQIIHDLRQAY